MTETPIADVYAALAQTGKITPAMLAVIPEQFHPLLRQHAARIGSWLATNADYAAACADEQKSQMIGLVQSGEPATLIMRQV